MTVAVSDAIVTKVARWRPKLLALSDETIRHKPTLDRWSIAEVVGHLVDSACNNHQRFVRAQETETLEFPKYDQNSWVAAGHYHDSEWQTLVTLWSSYNQQIAHVIRHIPASQLATPCTITPYETCTLQFLVEDYVTHLQHHLDKISERLDQ